MTKILLADHNLLLVRYYAQLLKCKRPDLEILTATTCDEVFDLLRDERLTLLSIDPTMGADEPGELLARVVAMRPDVKLILTSEVPFENGEVGDVQHAGVILKPLSSERFVRLIHRVAPPNSGPKPLTKVRAKGTVIRRQLFDLLVGLQAVRRSLSEEELPEETVRKVVDDQVGPLIEIASELSYNMTHRSTLDRSSGQRG